METQNKDEEVTFTPNVPADDEFVVTESASAEGDIKSALNAVDGIKPKVDPNVAIMRKLHNISNEIVGKVKSDGSTASYYELPPDAKQIQDLISHRNMNAQLGEIFRECYRYGLSEHCDTLRGAKKIKFYADAEVARLEKLEK